MELGRRNRVAPEEVSGFMPSQHKFGLNYATILWTKDRMRLDANFIPRAHYRVSGWLEERWIIRPLNPNGRDK